MLRMIAIAGMLLLLSPASAVTSKEKMETCKFGADNGKLTGAKRSQFLKNCMANRNDKRGAAAAGAMAAPKADGGNKDKQ